MSCACCDQLNSRLAAIEAKLANLKPVDEQKIIDKGAEKGAGIAASAAAVAYVKKPELEYAKQALERQLNMKADTSALRNFETLAEANANREALASRLQKEVNQAKDLANQAKSAASNALDDVKKLGSKIAGIMDDVFRAIDKAITPLKTALSKLSGMVDDLFGKIAGLLNRIGLLEPLKALLKVLGKILWIIDIISAFISFDTFAKVQGLIQRVDALEDRMDVMNNEMSGILSKIGTLTNQVRSADAKASQAIADAQKAVSEAMQANDKAKTAIAKASQAIAEAKTANSNATSAQTKATSAIGLANESIIQASGARTIAVDAQSAADEAGTSARDARAVARDALKSAIGAMDFARLAYADGLITKAQLKQLEQTVELAKQDIASLKSEDTNLRAKDTDLEARINKIKDITPDAVAGRLKADPGFINATKGQPGITGKNGIDGRNGINGINGVNGIAGAVGRAGRDGMNGLAGRPGRDGSPGRNGADGKNGKDGKDVNQEDVTALKNGQKQLSDELKGFNAGLPAIFAASLLLVRPALKPDFNQLQQSISKIPTSAPPATPTPTLTCHAFAAGQQTQQVVNTNTTQRIAVTNQRIGILNTTLTAINTFMQSKVMAGITTLMSNVTTISTKLGKLASWLKLDRALNILTFAATVHNAAMLSNDIAQTLVGALTNVLTLILPKDDSGNPFNINEAIGSTVENAVKGVIGTENYTNLANTWTKANRIYQASTNILNSFMNLSQTILQASELIAAYTGKIGNALKKAGVVLESAYGWMNPQPKFNRVSQTLENFQQTASTIQMVTQTPLDVINATTELTNASTEFTKAIKEDTPSNKAPDQPEPDQLKAKEILSKSVSVGLDMNDFDLEADD